MDKRHKPKNNNLSKHRELLQQRNTALVKRAIEHIRKLDGNITMSMVSKVTYEIARIEDKEKGITLAGISTSPIYRALVEEAKADSEMKQTAINGIKVKHYSDGDIRMMLHALRVENEDLKRTNKILSQQLREETNDIAYTEPIKDTLIKEYNQIKNTARSMVSRLCELELTYIDTNTETLRVMHYEKIIVPSDALNLFYKKELNDIQTNIRKYATDD